jgi:hypothetical protein
LAAKAVLAEAHIPADRKPLRAFQRQEARLSLRPRDLKEQR